MEKASNENSGDCVVNGGVTLVQPHRVAWLVRMRQWPLPAFNSLSNHPNNLTPITPSLLKSGFLRSTKVTKYSTKPQAKQITNEQNAQNPSETHEHPFHTTDFPPHPLQNLQGCFSFGLQFTENQWVGWNGEEGLSRRVHWRDGLREQSEGFGDAEEVYKLWHTEEGLSSVYEAWGFVLQLQGSWCGKPL